MKFVDNSEDGFDFSRLDLSNDGEELDLTVSMSDVVKVLPKLAPAYKRAFEMYYLDGLQHNEIAEKLGITPSTSKTNLMKAKKAIKKILGKRY